MFILRLIKIFFLILFTFSVSGQTKIDSLKSLLKTTNQDTVQIKALLDIGNLYRATNQDSSLFYYQKAYNIAKKAENKHYMALSLKSIGIIYDIRHEYREAVDFYEQSKRIYNEISDKNGIAACTFNTGLVFYNQRNYPDAISSFQHALKKYIALNDKKGVANCFSNIGNVYFMQGEYPMAIENYQKSLNIYEEFGDKKGIALCYNNIGGIHQKQGNLTKAADYFKKALKINEELGNKKGVAYCYNNLGLIIQMQGEYNSAVEHYLKAFEIDKEIGDEKDAAMCYANIGMIYFYQGNFEKATETYTQAYNLFKKTGDRQGEAIVLGNMAELYNTAGDKSSNQSDGKIYYDKAVDCAESSLQLAQSINALNEIKFGYFSLSKAYQGLGDYKKSLEYHILYTNAKDSLYNIQKNKQIEVMEARYQTEKKQLEVDNLNKEKALQSAELARKEEAMKKQRIMIYSFVLGFIMIFIFSVLLYRQYHAKKKANILLAKQNIEISQKNEKISHQRDEIQAQRDLVTRQKDEITFIHKELTDSINYAKRIQQAMLPDLVKCFTFAKCETFIDYFVLFKPKDVVSGDFYWGTTVNKWIIFCVGDCTGHGVPGAFLSMLCISILNEIVKKEEVTKTSEVLNQTRKYIVESLHQRDISDDNMSNELSVKDGMDIALCAIEKPNGIDVQPYVSTIRLQFAGANNPLFLIQTFAKQTFELKEIKGDKMPVAIHVKMEDFTEHIIELHKGDTLYLMSDGFADQFGGEKGKKFKAARLKELLLSVADKPMNVQKEIIETAIINWMSFINHETGHSFEQTDDITVMGLKI
ncbi:MAG: tetratricopeptide repeat protein [Bacteroidia bacterium]|nr:tetratricopeptide repeat protein [Bacteroidia bacterium]